jgi:branched-chain amino acid transport system ATP-binding protein
LTVRENLLVAQRAAKTSQTLVRDVEERFPMLREKRGQPASALSGGQQQILTLARALVMRPRYLVVDEPSLGLAPRIVSEVSQILSEVSQTGVGVLLAEQNVSLTADLCQRAILMSSDEPPREITMEDSATVNRTAREVYLERS